MSRRPRRDRRRLADLRHLHLQLGRRRSSSPDDGGSRSRSRRSARSGRASTGSTPPASPRSPPSRGAPTPGTTTASTGPELQEPGPDAGEDASAQRAHQAAAPPGRLQRAQRDELGEPDADRSPPRTSAGPTLRRPATTAGSCSTRRGSSSNALPRAPNGTGARGISGPLPGVARRIPTNPSVAPRASHPPAPSPSGRACSPHRSEAQDRRTRHRARSATRLHDPRGAAQRSRRPAVRGGRGDSPTPRGSRPRSTGAVPGGPCRLARTGRPEHLPERTAPAQARGDAGDRRPRGALRLARSPRLRRRARQLRHRGREGGAGRLQAADPRRGRPGQRHHGRRRHRRARRAPLLGQDLTWWDLAQEGQGAGPAADVPAHRSSCAGRTTSRCLRHHAAQLPQLPRALPRRPTASPPGA